MPNLIPMVLDQLHERRETTRAYFARLCSSGQLFEDLSQGHSWAIIGGAVRDILLQKSPQAVSFYFAGEADSVVYAPWRDLDIGIVDMKTRQDISGLTNRTTARRNSFGGVKIEDENLGPIDLWVWQAGNHVGSVDWQEFLSNVDFGLNAVAFVWPQQDVVLHERFTEDLLAGQVERLSSRVHHRNLQAVRAVALIDQMRERYGLQLHRGPRVGADLVWLAEAENRRQLSAAMDYARGKIREGRWSPTVLDLLDRVMGLGESGRGAQRKKGERKIDDDQESLALESPRTRSGKRWTPTEIEKLRDGVARGEVTQSVAKELGRSRSAVASQARRLGLA